MQSKKPKGEAVTLEANYQATEVSIDMNQIHYKDLIKLHQQSANVLYRDLDLEHATTHKLRKSLESVTTQYRLEKVVTQAKNVKIKVLEKALLELSEDPRNIKHSKNLLKEKDKVISLLKQKVKILGTHPTSIEEVNSILKEKEAETRMFLEADERNYAYMAQIDFLSGKLQSLTSGHILSSTERVTAEAEEVTAEKAQAVQLQIRLNEVELTLAASEAENLRLRHIIEEKDQYIAEFEEEAAEHRESAQGIETLKHTRHKVWTDT